MALPKHTLTGNVRDALGEDAGALALVRAWAEPSQPAVNDVEGNVLQLGRVPLSVNQSTGAFAVDLTETGEAVAGWKVVIAYRDAAFRAAQKSFDSGFFPMAADKTFAQAIEDAGSLSLVPVSESTLESVATYAAQAEAAKDAAEAVGATNDTIMAAVAADEESAFATGLAATVADVSRANAGEATSYQPMPAFPTPAYVSVGTDQRVGWLNAEGTTLYNTQHPQLRRSLDEGETWELLHTFDEKVGACRELPNGELLVGIYNNEAESVPGKVYTTTGYPALGAACTWTLRLTLNAKTLPNGWYGLSTPMHHHVDLPDDVNMGIVVLHSYGSKILPANTHTVHVSEDYGVTWRKIFEHFEGDNYHGHGAEYDPWYDRIWFTNGDSGHQAMRYSDNWRETTPTWESIWDYDTDPEAPIGVGLVAMPECILIGSDEIPDGVWRLARDETQTHRVGPREVVYEVDPQDPPAFAHFTRQIYKAANGAGVFFPFTSTDTTGSDYRGRVVATKDGRSFHEIWTDDPGYTDYSVFTVKGLFTFVGPTAAGNYHGDLKDERNTNTRLVLPAPTWRATPGLVRSEADRLYLTEAQADDRYAPPAEQVWLPARVFEPIAASGSASFPSYGAASTTGHGWIFDPALAECVATFLKVPAGWATVDVDLYWTVGFAAVPTDGAVQYRVRTADIGLLQQLDNSLSSFVATLTMPTMPGANRLILSTLVAGLAVNPARFTRFDVQRTASAGADTYAQESTLIGALLRKAS